MRLLYPPRCIACGDLVDSDFGLCGPCWRDTPFVAGPVCDGCGVPLSGPTDGHQLECDACMQAPRNWSMGRAATIYAGSARKLVLALKHGDRQEIARPAGRWLASAAVPLLVPDILVAPVPLHRFRLLKRRYNQSALLVDALARQLDLTACPDLLIRERQTATLEGKSREERFAELSGAIVANPRHLKLLKNRTVLLIDDVMTSGATLQASSAACRAAGALDVRVLVLARVANDT